MDDKQKKKYVAVARQLKEQKGLSVKQSGLQQDIKRYQGAQKEILDIKKQYADNEAVQKEADQNYKKLQSVINDLNEYMAILHPEGLLDFGSGTGGKSVMGQG